MKKDTSKKNTSFAKTNLPDSDESARRKHAEAEDEDIPDASEDIEGLQMSSKTGKHSSAEKLAASRPEFGTGAGAKPVDGAFGDDPNHPITGREAGPNTNQFQCDSCGRFFNTEAELSTHQVECRLAKEASGKWNKKRNTIF